MPSNKANTKTTVTGRPRSAITGKYVTKPYAVRHPRTTVIEKAPTKRRGTK
jgi:hypothetical protein